VRSLGVQRGLHILLVGVHLASLRRTSNSQNPGPPALLNSGRGRGDREAGVLTCAAPKLVGILAVACATLVAFFSDFMLPSNLDFDGISRLVLDYLTYEGCL
jgi:hypothetical protein